MTSIVVIAVFFLLVMLTIWIIFSTEVAELVATSARHVVTAFILLDPEHAV